MALTFTKAAAMQAIGGLLGTLIRFGITSAAISLTLYMIAWGAIQVQLKTGNSPFFVTEEPIGIYPEFQTDYVQNITVNNVTILGFLEEFNPDEYLMQFPIFKTLQYVKYLWYALLVPLFIGGTVYFLILSQGSDFSQRTVDYFGDIAWPTIKKTGLAVITLLIVGGVYLIGSMMYSGDMVVEGLSGLQFLGLLGFFTSLQQFFVEYYPFVPVAIELLAVIYLFKEVHAGWIGNQWA